MVVKYKDIPDAEELIHAERITIVVDEDLTVYTNEEIKKLGDIDLIGLVFCG